MVLMDCNTKGTREGNIKHASKTRPIALLSMTNVACIVFFTLGLLVLLISNLANLSRCDTQPVGRCILTEYGYVEVPATALF
jgi:hypothetical protein